MDCDGDGNDANNACSSSTPANLRGGFDYCQRLLNSGSTAASGNVHKTLYDAGYRTARFFGSTGTATGVGTTGYHFNDIANSPNALGDVRSRPLVTAVGGTFTVRMIGSPAVAMTLGDFTKATNRNANGDISNSSAVGVITDINTYSIDWNWGFSNRDGTYRTTASCSSATISNNAVIGNLGRIASGEYKYTQNISCSATLAILCVAR